MKCLLVELISELLEGPQKQTFKKKKSLAKENPSAGMKNCVCACVFSIIQVPH